MIPRPRGIAEVQDRVLEAAARQREAAMRYHQAAGRAFAQQAAEGVRRRQADAARQRRQGEMPIAEWLAVAGPMIPPLDPIGGHPQDGRPAIAHPDGNIPLAGGNRPPPAALQL